MLFVVDVADEGDLFSVGAPGGLSGVFLGGKLDGWGLSAEIGQPELVDVVEFFAFGFDGGDHINHLFAIGADRDRPDGTDLGEVGDQHGLFPGLGQHREVDEQEGKSDPTHDSGFGLNVRIKPVGRYDLGSSLPLHHVGYHGSTLIDGERFRDGPGGALVPRLW